MKLEFPHIGLAKLCGWFGLSRQAYYQNIRSEIRIRIEGELVIREVLGIRKKHPRIGTRKIYHMVQGFLSDHRIKMGRDALFDLLSAHGLLVRRRKRGSRTTQSSHWLRKYPNLVRDFVPGAPNELWVSDITYWKINDGRYLYISLVTDAYSHKVVGYQAAESLEAIESIKALKMAISACGGAGSHPPLTHHSDRGIQYCSSQYVKLLQDNNIGISMTENGDPLENALAERVNGIIKSEYLECYSIDNVDQAGVLLANAIELYNKERPHMSLGNMRPEEVHQGQMKKEKLWKNYYKNKNDIVNQFQD